MSEFDIHAARQARDKGMAQALDRDPDWKAGYRRVVQSIAPGTIVSGEDIRRLASPIIGEPPSSGAWGAACGGASRRGLLQKTGNMVQPKAVKSHGRAIQQYVRTTKL
jgi:hypothetical protein